MEVTLIHRTTGVEGSLYEGRTIDEIIVGQARVSTSRSDQELFDTPEKLIRHCILNQHWSIFELSNLGFKVETSRAIGREVLRHGTQAGLTEFSQRYAEVLNFEPIELRSQAKNNRQSSTDVINPDITMHSTESSMEIPANVLVDTHLEQTKELYNLLIEAGVARECARMVLPETAQTHIYLNFRVREIITFLNARLHKTAQKEVRLIAEQIRDIFIKECPIIANALFNFEEAYDHHIIDQLVLEKYKVRNQLILKK